MATDGGCERGVEHRVNEGCKSWGVLKSALINGGLGINAMMGQYKVINEPTALTEQRHGV